MKSLVKSILSIPQTAIGIPLRGSIFVEYQDLNQKTERKFEFLTTSSIEFLFVVNMQYHQLMQNSDSNDQIFQFLESLNFLQSKGAKCLRNGSRWQASLCKVKQGVVLPSLIILHLIQLIFDPINKVLTKIQFFQGQKQKTKVYWVKCVFNLQYENKQ